MNSRRKGKQGELEAAAELRRIFGIEARRGQQYCGGPESPDLVTSLADVHFEVKRTETFRPYEALGQAVRDAGEKIPVVLHRQNKRDWIAVVLLEDLPSLVAHLYLTLAANQPPSLATEDLKTERQTNDTRTSPLPGSSS